MYTTGIFASPSVAAVLAGIRAAAATNNKKGVLLVVKNYTGDRLNFGMACEKANQEGIPCRMVVVADDCALKREKGITGARGVAGTVLLHKILGAASKAGKSLLEMVEIAAQVSACIGTLGVALDAVTVPGAESVNDRLDDKTIEIGLGIHGEAGMKQSPLLSAADTAKDMVTTILQHGRILAKDAAASIVPFFKKGDDLCLLVNNLGGTSNFEMSILANSCVKELEGKGCNVSRLFVGSFMTSFNMHGASLTILNLSCLSDEVMNLLDAPCEAPAWPKCDINKQNARASASERSEVTVNESVSKLPKPPVTFDSFSSIAKDLTLKAVKELAAQEPVLTEFDTIVGDGDCGITMKRGASEVEDGLEKGTISTEHPVRMYAEIADAVSASMGGTSGVLLELMFRKMSSSLAQCSSIGATEMINGFRAGVDAISFYGGATVGSRTMLDALVPAVSSMEATGSLSSAATKAREGADGTAKMKTASAGRSNYLSEETLGGTPDPGAVAVAIVLEALS